LKEQKCRENYEELVAKLADYERSAELWLQLEMAGCDVWMGENDNVAGFDIKLHPLGSTDANLHIFCKEINNGIIKVPSYVPGGPPAETTVVNVRFMSLINVLIIEPLNLTEHDVYVCFDYKDPFSYFQPGYFGDKYPLNNRVILECDPMSIRDPMFKPAFFKEQRDDNKFTADDLEGTYTLGNGKANHDSLIKDEVQGPDRISKNDRTAVVTKQRGVMG